MLIDSLEHVMLRVRYLIYGNDNSLRINLPVEFTFNGTFYSASDINIPNGYEIDPDYPTIQATINSDSIDNLPTISSVNRLHGTAITVYLNKNYTGTLRLAIGIKLSKVN